MKNTLELFIFSPLRVVGDTFLRCVRELGALGVFSFYGFLFIFSSWKQIKRFFLQVYVIGASSLFLIGLIGLFTGMVLGLQGFYTLTKFGSEGFLGSAVAVTLVRELAPVLTAIMITGRAGSAMAAEIGVMRISDQIDALEVMDVNPYAYLISPRFSASLFVFPLLTAIFVVLGILGGAVTGVSLLGMNEGIYFSGVLDSVAQRDVIGCLVKSVFFALTVVSICCYKGYFSHMRRDSVGPAAVGNATTSAVVLSCISLLVVDYIITSILL